MKNSRIYYFSMDQFLLFFFFVVATVDDRSWERSSSLD